MSLIALEPTPFGPLFNLPVEIFNIIFDDVFDGSILAPGWDGNWNPEINRDTGLVKGISSQFGVNNILAVNRAWQRYFWPQILARTQWTFENSSDFFDFLEGISELGVERPDTFIRELWIQSRLVYRNCWGGRYDVVPLLKSMARGNSLPNLKKFRFEFEVWNMRSPADAMYVDMDLRDNELFETVKWLGRVRVPRAYFDGLANESWAQEIYESMLQPPRPVIEATDEIYQDLHTLWE